jgi:hypothetical protein
MRSFLLRQWSQDESLSYEDRDLLASAADEIDSMGDSLVAERNFHASLVEENERLRKALEFYANPEIYKPHPHGPAFDRRDLSFHAVAALTKE